MDTNPLFTAALGLASPWLVTHTDFQAAQRELRLHVDFKKGATFSCPSCHVGGCKVHDTVEKEWRHIDFFQHKAFIIARVPGLDVIGVASIRLMCPGRVPAAALRY